MLSYHNITTEKYRYISFHLKSNTGKLFADSHTLVALPCLFTLYHQPLSNIVIQQCVEQVKAPNSDQTYLIDTKADEVMETKAILRNLKVLYSKLFKKKPSSLPCFRNCYFQDLILESLSYLLFFPSVIVHALIYPIKPHYKQRQLTILYMIQCRQRLTLSSNLKYLGIDYYVYLLRFSLESLPKPFDQGVFELQLYNYISNFGE